LSVELTIDAASLANFNKQMDLLKKEGNRTLLSALIKAGMKIKTEAQLRLSGRKHVVTSRLKNSIYLKAKNEVGSKQYSDLNGKSYNADLTTVKVEANEIAVGTNVEYAAKIENMDSYLYWALQNVNIEQSVAKDMKDLEKFSK
jgi:hypothetical protein